ncbi:MAG: hypothetical protein PHE74_02345 [Comamonas sp.]|nr:hypothetical protein [Comamonas sp.]
MLEPQKTKPEKKPQARGFHPHAMAQAQALNQQPDSIPAMMKPGEYVLPPDTVQALGGPQALDATVAQTHTPTNAGAIVPRGFGPRLFFNNGGLVQDEEQKPKPISPSNIYPQGSPSAGANVYGGAIDAAKSAVSAAANPQGGQPLVNGAAQVFGQREALQQQGRERWDASVAARQPAAPSAPQPPTTDEANTRLSQQITAAQNQQQERMAAAQRTQAYDNTVRQQLGQQSTADAGGTASFTGDVLRTAGQDAQAAWQRGGAEGVGAAAGALVRGSMATPGAIAVDAVDSVVNGPIGQGVGGFARGLFGGAGQEPASAAPAAPATPARQPAAGGTGTGAAAPDRTPEQLAKQLGGLDRQHAQNVQLQAAARTPEQALAGAAQQPAGQQVQGLPGVYQHGRGQYSDSAQGMGFAPGFTGQPSARNMQAAGNLSAQQQAQSAARVAAAQQEPAARGFPGFAAPEISHSGNDWSTRNELRSLRMAAERAMENAPRKRFAAQHPAVQAYQAALQGDMAARTGGQAALQAKTNDTNAGLVREQMQQQGATQRDMARNAIDQQRVGLDGQRLGLAAQQQQEQSTARGFDIRAAQRKQSFQEAWAKGTKEQREQLQQMYPDLMPTDKEKPRFEVVRGRNNPVTGESGQDYVLRMHPNGTVEQVPVEGMGQGQPKPMPKNKGERVAGNLYVDNNGQLVLWTEKGAVSAQ